MKTAYLKVLRGSSRGLNIPLIDGTVLVFGRTEGDVILADPLVSGEHCRLERRGSGLYMTDLGSRNGVIVDGQAVTEATLVAGSQIEIGSTLMVVVVTQEPMPMLECSTAIATADTAWLLDEELGVSGHSLGPQEVPLDQGLHVPFRLSLGFEVLTGPRKGSFCDLTQGGAIIGRNHGDVPLVDDEVSRRHAIVEVFGRGMIFVRDLDSTNGTFHNGRRIQVAKLTIGDNLSCGATTLRLVEGG